MNSPSNITLESEDSITALIALGANLPSKVGTPIETLNFAKECIRKFCIGELTSSSFYQTEAVGCAPGSPDFINAVVVAPLPTKMEPSELLERLKNLESQCGRETNQAENSPRPLDLDILCFGNLILATPQLELPHPRAHIRRFVIEPLAEIAPEFMLPGQSVSVRNLLETLPSSPRVNKLTL